MKRVSTALVLLLSMFVTLGDSYGQDGLPGLLGPYLGQKPPGVVPEPFAPGLITSERWEYGVAISPDMKELYLLRDDANEKTEFVVFYQDKDRWHEKVISRRVGQPFVSPDGKTMHLGKRYLTQTDSGWSELKMQSGAFQEIRIMRLTASSQGTYVFDEVGNDGDGIIRYSKLVNGKRSKPKPMSKAINSGTWNAHPYIAPDESYILWDGRRGEGHGNSDIYISYKQKNGSWGEAINLGDKINTDAWEASATVSPDGNYLFFNRMTSPGNVDIFWVSAAFIKELRPKA